MERICQGHAARGRNVRPVAASTRFCCIMMLDRKETTEADTNVTAHCTKASAACVVLHQADTFDVAIHYNSLTVPVMLYHKDAPDESIIVCCWITNPTDHGQTEGYWTTSQDKAGDDVGRKNNQQ